jgi:hypothetical protein
MGSPPFASKELMRWVCLIVMLAGCASGVRPELAEPIDAGRCEDAAQFLEQHRRGPTGASRVRQVLTGPLSYVLTGLGYTTEVVLVVGGGLVLSGVVCSPVIAIEVAAEGNGQGSVECVTRVAGALLDDHELPGLGRIIYESTESWRCTDLTPLSQELRALAACHARRGGSADLDKARQQLVMLKESRPIYECVAERERWAIDQALESLPDAVAAAESDDL